MWLFLLLASFTKTLFQAYTAFILFILPLVRDELRLKSRICDDSVSRPFRTFPELRQSPEGIVVTYRCLQIIMKEICLVFGPYLPSIQAIIVQAAIFTGYVLIGHEKNGVDGWTMLILMAVAPFLVLSWAALLTAARVHKASKDCIGSWKRELETFPRMGDRKYVAKFRRSCAPLYFGFQGYTTVKHGTVLKFMQAIVRGTLRALLTLRKM